MSVTAISHPKSDASEAATADGATPKKSGKKKKLIIIIAALALVAGGAYWFVLKPAPSGPPKPGTVLMIDPIQVNLAGGHYLKIGVALQLIQGAETPDTAKALDAVIAEFSGRSMDALAQPGQRNRLKKELTSTLATSYDHDVMGVYFTDFVTQ